MLNNFDITGSDSKNLKRIRECFPHLVVESVQTNHDGLTNDILRLNDASQEQIASQLATYLQQLHSIPIDEVERQGIAYSDTNRTHQKWVKLFENVEAEMFPLMMPNAREWVVNHFAPVLADEDWMVF